MTTYMTDVFFDNYQFISHHKDILTVRKIINDICGKIKLAGEKITTQKGYPSFILHVPYCYKRVHAEFHFSEYCYYSLKRSDFLCLVFEKFIPKLLSHELAITSLITEREIKTLKDFVQDDMEFLNDYYHPKYKNTEICWISIRNIVSHKAPFDHNLPNPDNMDKLINDINRYLKFICTDSIVREKYEDSKRKNLIPKFDSLVEELNKVGFSYEDMITQINSTMIKSLMKE